MKLTLVFLCAAVVISHQQFIRPRGTVWLSPYFPKQPAVNNYQQQYYNHPDEESLFLRNLRIAYSQDGLYKDQLGLENQYGMDENDYIDPQLRIKGLYQPSVSQSQNGRFLFGGGLLKSPFVRIAATTVTSIVNVTSVQVCIPVAQFVVPASTLACRRRKREKEILDSFDAFDSEYSQYPLTPSRTQQLLPSATTSLLPENHELGGRNDEIDHGITSSKDDFVNDDMPTLSNSQRQNLRDKRFLFPIFTTTLTQYSISSVVSIRSISNALVAASALSCLPPGIIVCPAVVG